MSTQNVISDFSSIISHLKYSDRLNLKAYKLPTSCYMYSTSHNRRIKGDMIETYKILTGKYSMLTV